QSKLVKYFSRQLSCKRKVALQERNAKLEGFPQLLHWFRIVDIRKEVMEEIAPGQLSLEDLLDMTDDQVCATVEKFGANREECARLNASLSCLRSVHKSGEKNPSLEGIWELCWCAGEEGRVDLPDIPVLPSWVIPASIPEGCGSWDRGASQKSLGIPKSLVCSPGNSFWEGNEHWDHPEEQLGCRAASPAPTGIPSNSQPFILRKTKEPCSLLNKLKPPGTPPPSSRKLIHLIPGFTALHRSKSHEFQLGHRVDEAHTPKREAGVPQADLWNGLSGKRRSGPSCPNPCHGQGHFPLSQAAPSPNVQPGLGHCQGSRGSHSCSGHPVPGPAHPAREQFLPNIPSSPALWQWEAIPCPDGSLILLLCNLDNNDVSPCSNSHPPGELTIGCSARAGIGVRAAPLTFPSFGKAGGLLALGMSRRWIAPLPVACQGHAGGGCHPSPGWFPPFPAQLIPSSAAVDFGMSCAARSRSPDLCWGWGGKHGGVGRRVAFPGTAAVLPPGNGFFPHNFIVPDALCPPQNEEGAEEVQESEDDFEEMNLSLLSARNFPRKASQTSIFLQEWDIPFEQLEIGELIGKGRFGQVFHGRWHGEVAIRLIDIERDNEDQLKAFKREVMAYRQTRHENVVLFMGACMSPPHLAIITSLCKGRTLYSVVRDAKIVLDVNKTRQIAQEIVKGMGYLHAKGILHKDLKSKNVFYDNGKVVITDFGLFSISGVLQAGRRENKLRIQNGWLCHLAPEIIRQLSPDTEEDKLPFSKHSDVFALGTIWYELHAREWPFKTQPAEAIIWQVGRGMKPNLSQIGMGKEISDILLFCWAYEQEERPTFTKLMDMLEKLPKRNRRLSHPGHFWKSAE
ncbi:KSR2 Kinase, partial [Sterrhoptilus dennistouni]|nr:KSR2 Kinase [Sterrhoptilus dennistouni]